MQNMQAAPSAGRVCCPAPVNVASAGNFISRTQGTACRQQQPPPASCRRSVPPTRHCHQRQLSLTAIRAAAASAAQDIEDDVCVLGAGIIGLCTALTLLRADPQLRVVVVDRAVPCSGATGAGQGYLWLAHRDPSSPAWHMAVRSKQMWRELLAPTVPQLTAAAVEWQAVGSVLLASNEEESEALRQRQQLLAAAGLAEAGHLSAAAVQQLEPALRLSPAGSALLVPTDAQVNGKQTAAALQRACEAYGSGRFMTLFDEGAEGLVVGSSGRIEAVQTEARRIHATRGVVVAMGAWSGLFLAQQLSEERWADAFRPRRGLLLEMPRPEGMPAVKHGLMEMGYTKHYTRGAHSAGAGAAASGSSSDVDITFTATTSASGTLLVGSSREFVGFDSSAPEAIVDSIMQRAAEFLPALAAVQRQDIYVRAGPRPYATAGSPMVGPVPGTQGLFVAAGHEGSGLTLAPATAELICDHMLGRQPALAAAVVDSLAVPYH